MAPPRRTHGSQLPLSEDAYGRQVHLHPFLPTFETSSFPCAEGFLISPCEVGCYGSDHQRSHHEQQETNQDVRSTGSTNISSLPATAAPATDDESSNKNNAGESDPSSRGRSKWMPSKRRLMRKMMTSDRTAASKPRKSTMQGQDQQESTADANHSGAAIRVCSDCNTTKTPLWRSGPRGPKSLCNACGIRQRKARRAMAAAALTGGLIPAVAPAKVPKEKRSDGECAVPLKKRCKFTAAEPGKKLHVDEFAIWLSKDSAFHRVFPQDEREAALLLMALSCGLIRG